jgi:hypothetical protein
MKILGIVILAAVLAPASSGAQSVLGGIQLLDGYSLKRESAVDTVAWKIEGRNGMTINFEAGASEGSAADPAEREKYSWYREQWIRGYKVRVALVRPGLKTRWEAANSRGAPSGNTLLVTFLLDKHHPNHTANFETKITNPGELADSLLMILTFDPSNGTF